MTHSYKIKYQNKEHQKKQVAEDKSSMTLFVCVVKFVSNVLCTYIHSMF